MDNRGGDPSPAAEEGSAGAGPRDEYEGQRSNRVLASNLRYLDVSQVAARFAGFAVVILLARELGRGDFGRYTVALGVASILAMLIQLGMGGYIIREAARARRP